MALKSTALSAEPRDTPSMPCKYGLLWLLWLDISRGKTKEICNEYQSAHNKSWIFMFVSSTQSTCSTEMLASATRTIISEFPLLNILLFMLFHYFLFHIPHLSPSAFHGMFHVVPRSFCCFHLLCLKFRNRVKSVKSGTFREQAFGALVRALPAT